jgi:hypothetical protein
MIYICLDDCRKTAISALKVDEWPGIKLQLVINPYNSDFISKRTNNCLASRIEHDHPLLCLTRITAMIDKTNKFDETIEGGLNQGLRFLSLGTDGSAGGVMLISSELFLEKDAFESISSTSLMKLNLIDWIS